MRTTRLAMMVLMSGVGAACAPATRTLPDGLHSEMSLTQTTRDERRQLRDSAFAQEVADEVGPRVNVRATMEPSAGSRRVDVTFHMYDDAYVIVGHLDAAGRLTVVFPSQPGDDGFVRGDKIYHVPSFFAGFTDEYAWRHSNYRYSRHTVSSRWDSYDAGLAYVFVVASWRPMRLDRITDGSRWQSYEVTDINYMADPREAIEELGATIAGDNREAYTIEYAHYSTTNYGTYAYSDFDAVNSGCYGNNGFLGFSHQFFSALSPFGFGYSSACSSAYGTFGYPYVYAYSPYYPATPAPPVPGSPRRPRGTLTPYGASILHLPRVETGQGIALHPRSATPDGTGSQYRRPGLFAEDAGGRRTPGERQTPGNDPGFTSRRPTIQQMIGNRRADEEGRGRTAPGVGISRDNPSWPGRFSNGSSSSHAAPRGESNGQSTRAVPSHAEPRGESRPSAPARTEGAPHAAPAHSEPSVRSAPASSGSSSSGSKKP